MPEVKTDLNRSVAVPMGSILQQTGKTPLCGNNAITYRPIVHDEKV